MGTHPGERILAGGMLTDTGFWTDLVLLLLLLLVAPLLLRRTREILWGPCRRDDREEEAEYQRYAGRRERGRRVSSTSQPSRRCLSSSDSSSDARPPACDHGPTAQLTCSVRRERSKRYVAEPASPTSADTLPSYRNLAQKPHGARAKERGMPPGEHDQSIRRRDRESPVRTMPRSISMEEECESPLRMLPRSKSMDRAEVADRRSPCSSCALPPISRESNPQRRADAGRRADAERRTDAERRADAEFYAQVKLMQEQHSQHLLAVKAEYEVMKKELLQRIERLEHKIVSEHSLSRTPANAQIPPSTPGTPGTSRAGLRSASNTPPSTPLAGLRPASSQASKTKKQSSGSLFYKHVIVNAASREHGGMMRRTVSEASISMGELS